MSFARPMSMERHASLQARRPDTFKLLAVAGVLCIAGCKCSETSNKPYNPLGVVTALAPEAPMPPDASVESPNELKPQLQSTQSLSSSSSLPDAFMRADGDSKRLYRLLIQANFDEDSATEGVAWSVPERSSQTAEAGQLWYLQSDDVPRRLAGFPTYVPVGPECPPDVTLTHSGVHSVTLDVQTTCKGFSPPGAANRALLIFSPARRLAQLLELKLASPTGDSSVEVLSNTRDRDGDGHDDVELFFELRTNDAPGSTARLPMRWFDRPSGMSRDESEPAKAFQAKGSVEVVRSRGRTTSKGLAERLNAYRSLATYLCDEGGMPGLTDQDGGSFRCGNLRSALGFFSLAEGQAALTQNRVRSAIGALARDDWYLGGGSASGRKKLAAGILKRVTRLKAKERLFGLSVNPRSPSPQFSPLWFNDHGQLHALSPLGVLRLEGTQFHDVSEHLDPWPQLVYGPQGQRLSGATYPCNQRQVELQAQERGGLFVSALGTKLLAPRPGYCRPGHAFEPPSLRPIQWDSGGLSALLGIEWLGSKLARPAPGSPVSNSGEYYVAPTPLGLFVGNDKQLRLIELERADELALCVVNNNATSVACLRGDAVSILSLND